MTMKQGAAGGLALGALVLVAGCGGASKVPSVSDFSAGSCRVAAPAVLRVGALARAAHSDHAVHGDVQQKLAVAQGELRRLTDKPAGTADLVAAIGFLRLALDTHTYQPRLLSDVMNAQHAVQHACTAKNGAESGPAR
ncbi:MAG: hypothetical protein ACJ735_04345 [Actinomycetes bacterium]